MIDLHCHILPGIDDGPSDMAGAIEFARAAGEAGSTTMIATPHVSPRYPNESSTISAGVRDLNACLAEAGIELEVLCGAEISILEAADLADDELQRLALGGGPWLLIESPITMMADSLPLLIGQIQAHGHRIVLAHPERCQAFQRRPDLLETLVHQQGVLTSVTAGALIGRFGREVQRFALTLAAKGLIHNIASDAHDCGRRPPGIADEMRRAGLGEHIQLLTDAVPRAILAGTRLPDMPQTLLAERHGPQLWRRSHKVRSWRRTGAGGGDARL